MCEGRGMKERWEEKGGRKKVWGKYEKKSCEGERCERNVWGERDVKEKWDWDGGGGGGESWG